MVNYGKYIVIMRNIVFVIFLFKIILLFLHNKSPIMGMNITLFNF